MSSVWILVPICIIGYISYFIEWEGDNCAGNHIKKMEEPEENFRDYHDVRQLGFRYIVQI